MLNTGFSSAMTWIITLRTLCFLDRASLYNLADKANLVHNFSWYVYFFSLHVSGDYVPIIGRNNCIYAMLGTCYSVWMTVWYAPCILDRLWAHSRPKRIEKRNRHTKKNCAPSWLYLQDYTFRTAVHLFPVETSNLKIL